MQTISPSYYEASAIDGATRWQQFRHVTLPLLMPNLLVVFVLIGFLVIPPVIVQGTELAQQLRLPLGTVKTRARLALLADLPAVVPTEEGLRRTVAWYRDNPSWREPIRSGDYRAYYERQYGRALG